MKTNEELLKEADAWLKKQRQSGNNFRAPVSFDLINELASALRREMEKKS